MISVRKFQQKDKPMLEKICIETSALPAKTENEQRFLMLMFNDYYTDVEGENCFVAVNENDEAVGYILCAENFDTYLKILKKTYLPQIKKLGIGFYIQAIGEIVIHKAFSAKYPSHLHIDILPVCQGQGAGSALVRELKGHLKNKGYSSVMLSCGMSNKRAIRFYEKNGFKTVRKIMGSCIMVLEF